ncbi:MAG: hypothetical protein AB1295_05670 [Candidatus Micrarchaeota archaeon]
MELEDSRQFFHMVVGFAAIAVLLIWGRGVLLAAVFFTIIIGTVLMNLRLLGRSIPLIEWFEERFERKGVPLPGWGSACFATGALVAAAFLKDPSQIAAVLLALGIGDGISNIIGRRGGTRLPYNRKKTVEGMAAMFASSLLAWVFIGPLALPLALIAAVAESVPRLDDNLTVPVACTLFLLVVG